MYRELEVGSLALIIVVGHSARPLRVLSRLRDLQQESLLCFPLGWSDVRVELELFLLFW